jgi:hypothetical protein
MTGQREIISRYSGALSAKLQEIPVDSFAANGIMQGSLPVSERLLQVTSV